MTTTIVTYHCQCCPFVAVDGVAFSYHDCRRYQSPGQRGITRQYERPGMSYYWRGRRGHFTQRDKGGG
jgi:hypothetical protein